MNNATKYAMIKAPAPHLLHCQGNLQRFPRPTAEPTAASQKVIRPDQESLSATTWPPCFGSEVEALGDWASTGILVVAILFC